MADSITHFKLYRSSVSETGPWTLMPGGTPSGAGCTYTSSPGNLPGTARCYQDTSVPSPTYWYKLEGYTANGVIIPYNVVSVTEAAPSWPRHLGGAGNEYAYVIAQDSSGNLIVAGSFTGSVNFGGDTLNSAGGSDLFIVKFSPTGGHLWSRRYGGANNEPTPTTIAVDTSGNIVLGGSFYGTINVGGSNLTAISADADPWLARYDSSGNHLWSITFLRGVNADRVYGVATDSSGNVFAAGAFQGGNFVNQLPINNGKTLYSDSGSEDGFLCKFNSAGLCQWAVAFGSGSVEQSVGITLDAGGNVYVVGFSRSGIFINSVFYEPGGFLTKWSNAGAHIQSRNIGLSGVMDGYARAYAVAIDSAGKITICGQFTRQSDFGGGMIFGDADPANGIDAFIAQYDSSFNWQWSRKVSHDTKQVVLQKLTTDSQNNVIATGYFTGTVNFAGTSFTHPGGVNINGFICKYSSAGTELWARPLLTANLSTAGNAVCDTSNRVFLIASYFGTVTFNGQSYTSTAGTSDGLILRISPNG